MYPFTSNLTRLPAIPSDLPNEQVHPASNTSINQFILSQERWQKRQVLWVHTSLTLTLTLQQDVDHRFYGLKLNSRDCDSRRQGCISSRAQMRAGRRL